jgi:hypothetical protein
VFAYATAGENAPKWQGGVESIVNEGAPTTVGSKYTEVRKFLGQEMKTALEIVEVAPNAKWAAKVLKGPVPYQVTVTYEASGGGTKMTTVVEGEPTGFFKIAEGMVASSLQKSLAEDGERLKKILEGG